MISLIVAFDKTSGMVEEKVFEIGDERFLLINWMSCEKCLGSSVKKTRWWSRFTMWRARVVICNKR